MAIVLVLGGGALIVFALALYSKGRLAAALTLAAYALMVATPVALLLQEDVLRRGFWAGYLGVFMLVPPYVREGRLVSRDQALGLNTFLWRLRWLYLASGALIIATALFQLASENLTSAFMAAVGYALVGWVVLPRIWKLQPVHGS